MRARHRDPGGKHLDRWLKKHRYIVQWSPIHLAFHRFPWGDARHKIVKVGDE